MRDIDDQKLRKHNLGGLGTYREISQGLVKLLTRELSTVFGDRGDQLLYPRNRAQYVRNNDAKS